MISFPVISDFVSLEKHLSLFQGQTGRMGQGEKRLTFFVKANRTTRVAHVVLPSQYTRTN